MFRIKLSPESRARLEYEENEAARLYELTDRWLGEALIALARQAQESLRVRDPFYSTYDNAFVFNVVPEIAKRLGVTAFMASERLDADVVMLSNAELRRDAGHCLRNIGHSQYYGQSGWNMLLRELANGNPVVYALDRLHPGRSDDMDDPIVRRLSEIARIRDVVFSGVWDPGMLMKPKAGTRTCMRL